MEQISPTDWAQIISAVGAMTAAIVAVIAAIQSYGSAKQNNETNEQMIRPRVVVYVENSLHNIAYLDLVILNEGGGLARDINLVVNGDEPSLRFSDNTDKSLSSLDAIKHGITVLPARSSRSYFMMSSDTKDDTKKILDLKTDVSISYTDSTNKKKYQDIFRLDFKSLPKMRLVDKAESDRKKIIAEMKNITKALEDKK